MIETNIHFELAEKQFNEMRKESDEDDDGDIVGGSCDEDYEDLNINISVDGYWESVIHFDYIVRDLSTNEILEEGKHAY